MKFTTTLLTSTATAALLIAFGTSGALAQQATSDTNLGTTETIVTSATFTAGNVQELTATPSATTSNNNVNISLTASDTYTDVVTAAAPATNNLTTASATGNSSTAAAGLLFSPSTAGDTAAVGTLQSVEADVSANSTTDIHSIVIVNTGSGIRTLTGTSLSDNNDMTAAATGNSATSTITAASGLDLLQAAAGQANLDIDSSLGAPADNDVAGDLIVSSSQEIDGDLTLGATVTGAVTRTRVEGLDTATVTVSNSDQASTAIGNSATSSISSLDTTASITASTAVSNLQTIVPTTAAGTTISATTTGSTIEVVSGIDAASGTNATGDVINTTISVAGNDQTAGATGSVSTQSITLDASSITGEAAAAVIKDASTTTNTLQLSADGDSIIGNVQTIASNVTVSGTVRGGNIRSEVVDLAFANGNDVTFSTLEVTDNRQAASATGVSTSNALSLTSGATMSAAGAVGSVQKVDGSVTAVTTSNTITNAINTGNANNIDDDLEDSSMRTTANAVTSAATGATATNSLSTTSATNNLSVATNTGTVANSVAGATTGADQYSVTAGQALTNDQSISLAAAVVSAETTANQILTQAGEDVTDSTVVTDSNSMSASATANSADNGILLSFNNLVGSASGSGAGVIAATANEQTLADDAKVTARVLGTSGVPIRTTVGSDVQRSSVSTSGNTVSASARGNVTSGNDVVVDATNITTGSEAAPSITQSNGAQTTTGSFVAASTQLSGADILASQRDSAATPTTSNTIRTDVDNNIEQSSTVVSDDNVLSAVATANSANNAVQLGDANTATVKASGTVANYQATATAGSVTAEIGITGSDPIAAFSSSSSAGPQNAGTGTLATGLTNDVFTNGPAAIVYSFTPTLTAQEQAILTQAGFTSVTSNSATIAANAIINTAGGTSARLINLTFTTGSPNTLAFASFSGAATAGVVNGAGVIVRVDADADGGGGISASTVSVSGNTAVGEVTGNVATNVTSATATTVTGLSAAPTSINASDFNVAPTNADLATASLQDSASVLSSDVAATFAILDGLGVIDSVTNSTQTVSDNLQQSYATANRATNSVDLTATNTDADTALESAQRSTATVSTTSDLDVVANAGGTTSSLAMEGNVNQSVANGNVATNATTVDVTNATNATTVDATISSSIAGANNALLSMQSVSASVTASATTDVYNQDTTRTAGNEIISSDVSLSSNSTIAQATGNNGTQTLTLGDAGTANMDRTGVLMNSQAVGTVTVSSTVDQVVFVSLSNTGTIPIQSSSVSLDGNQTTALARSNVASNTLTVDGNSIDAGVGTDATFTGSAAAYLLGSFQDNDAVVTATTTGSGVGVGVSDTGASGSGGGVLNSTVSVAGNVFSATALANSVVNAVSVGANASNVDAAAELLSDQDNSGAVTATGGSVVGVADIVTGGTTPTGINGSSVMVSGNVSASNATGNQAQNSLTTSGANIVSGTTGTNANASSSPSPFTASGGNLVVNVQDNTGAINSTNTANTLGIASTTVDGTTAGSGAAASGSTLGVTGNVTEARASANLATNSSITIGGAGTASLDSTALVMNSQTNGTAGAVDASATTDTRVTLDGTSNTTAALNTGTAMVQGNSTLALARGNVAQNTVVANGANVTGGSSPASLNSTAGVLGGALNASFGVFNEQSQAAPIGATSSGTNYRVDATSGTRTSGSLGFALNGSSATVSGNSINASAFGNIATNSVTLASLSTAANDASAAVFNGQSNSGAITSSATGATIGSFSTGGVVSASVGVSNNSISASSIGNFASSTVTRTDR